MKVYINWTEEYPVANIIREKDLMIQEFPTL